MYPIVYQNNRDELDIFAKNKFVRTKMRPEEGTKIELQIEICQILSICQICKFRFVRFIRFADFRDLKKTGDGPTNRRMDGPTDGRTLL